ncbi:MAG TPA: sigma-54 dependent transcriptional regulator [Kofleriaceae bacterium]
MTGAVLIVDDDRDTAEMLRDGLKKRGFDAFAVFSGEECVEHLRSHPVDIVITDVQMPGMSGIELSSYLREHHRDVLVIVVTGQGGLDLAVAAIRVGAYDFITKPVKMDALAISVTRAIDHSNLRRELQRLRSETARTEVEGIIGASTAIREMIELIRRVSDSDATVLVAGESGTGKELVARAIHRLSPRRDEPFVAINCAAVPAPLLESELFGHVRGAFTDAKQARPGLFIQARRGTIFLDEIGEMPIEMQVKLLRVLQQRSLRPVGGDEELPFEGRIIAATNKDLETEVEEKRFREDLFYRINVVPITVPPLRARSGDVLLLAQSFLARAANRIRKPVRGISEPAARLLMEYDWPGNVRELENSIERAVALCRLDEITVDDLPMKVQQHHKKQIVISTDVPAELITLDEMERRYVRQVLVAVGGNKTHAARMLGIDRRSLYRRLEPQQRGDEGRDSSPAVPAPTTPATEPEDDSAGHPAR